MTADRPPRTPPGRAGATLHGARNGLGGVGGLVGLALVLAFATGTASPADAAVSRDRPAAAGSAKAVSTSAKAAPSARTATAARSSKATSPARAAAADRRGAAASTRSTGPRAAAKADRRAPSARTARAASERAPTRRAARPAPRVVVAPRPSMGQLAGLRATEDPLDLNSSVALVVDQDTGDVLLSKNPDAVLPIASITKLMTALVVAETDQPLDETLTITEADIDTEKGSRSRLAIGTRLTRGEMLHLALMSSENRAANALGRHYPGGLRAFVSAMNAKAQLLGMTDTEYAEPTGLSSRNRSSARDLAMLVEAAYRHETIRELSTSTGMQVDGGARPLAFHNTNRLVHSPDWEIGLQKTGFISEAGRCLVMQAQVAGRALIMVFLDSAGRHSRLGDAERVRQWVASGAPVVARSSGDGSARPEAGKASAAPVHEPLVDVDAAGAKVGRSDPIGDRVVEAADL